MTTYEALLRQHLHFESCHDAEGAASTSRDDGFYANHALGLRFDGRDGVALQYAASNDAIIDMRADYLFQHDDGDRILQCGRITGRAADAILGVPTAGGQLDFPFLAMITFADGAMSGEHIIYDLHQFCAQAGADFDTVRRAASDFARLLQDD
jgi:hypothetical protein